MNSTTATMEPAQRDAGGFFADALWLPAHRPDGLRPQGGEQAANQRRPFRRHESKFLSFPILLSFPSLVSLLGAAVGFVSSATATDYYVSPKGNDSNDGKSPQTAWQTLDKISRFQFHPGDKILLEGGQTFNGTLKFENSGMVGAPIVFTNYGREKAKIIEEKKATVYFNSNKYIEISNFELCAKNSEGIMFGGNKGSSDINLLNLYIHDCGNNGIMRKYCQKDENILVSNCTISNNKEKAIDFRGKSITLRNNHIKGKIGLYEVQKAELIGNTIEGTLEVNPPIADYKASGNTWYAKSFGEEIFKWGAERMTLGRLRGNSASKQHKDDKILTPAMRQNMSQTQTAPQAPQLPLVQPQAPAYQTNQPGYQNLTPFQRWQLMQKGKR